MEKVIETPGYWHEDNDVNNDNNNNVNNDDDNDLNDDDNNDDTDDNNGDDKNKDKKISWTWEKMSIFTERQGEILKGWTNNFQIQQYTTFWG